MFTRYNFEMDCEQVPTSPIEALLLVVDNNKQAAIFEFTMCSELGYIKIMATKGQKRDNCVFKYADWTQVVALSVHNESTMTAP